MSDWPVPDWAGKVNNEELPYISVSQEDPSEEQDGTVLETSCIEEKFLMAATNNREDDVDICSTAPLLGSGINTPTTECEHGLLSLCDSHFTRSVSECIAASDLISGQPINEKLQGQVEIELSGCQNKTYFFSSWNWPLIRSFASYLSAGTVASIILVSVALIANLPSECGMTMNWWEGTVFVESKELQQSDLNKIADLGAVGVIIKDLFEINKDGLEERFDENVLHNFIVYGFAKNLSFIGEVYIENYSKSHIVRMFARVEELELNGLLLRGMNVSNENIAEIKDEWNKIAHKKHMQKKILIVTIDFARIFGPTMASKFDLIYTPLNLENGNSLKMQVDGESEDEPEGPWIQWGLSYKEELLQIKASQFLQIVLPGSVLLQYDPLMLNDCTDSGFYSNLKTLIKLRQNSRAISSNRVLITGDYATLLEKNTVIRILDFLVVIERFYPRSKRYVYIGNLGNFTIRSESIYKYYFGGTIVASTIGKKGIVDFKNFGLDAGEAVVIEMSI
ncbi:uncharacterized protein LOC136042104 [Artemia franciscana]|uniref:Uncharacterized protein n=1 Tax=Artemia franciscana TaxID=6661 RepID=A0AA88KRK7_ARTSF|nr:hypothetical protein QYM36_018360 [Artemia franciscana]